MLRLLLNEQNQHAFLNRGNNTLNLPIKLPKSSGEDVVEYIVACVKCLYLVTPVSIYQNKHVFHNQEEKKNFLPSLPKALLLL